MTPDDPVAALLACGRELLALLGPDSRPSLVREALERRARLLQAAAPHLREASAQIREQVARQDAELLNMARLRRDQARAGLRWCPGGAGRPAEALDLRA